MDCVCKRFDPGICIIHRDLAILSAGPLQFSFRFPTSWRTSKPLPSFLYAVEEPSPEARRRTLQQPGALLLQPSSIDVVVLSSSTATRRPAEASTSPKTDRNPSSSFPVTSP